MEEEFASFSLKYFYRIIKKKHNKRKVFLVVVHEDDDYDDYINEHKKIELIFI